MNCRWVSSLARYPLAAVALAYELVRFVSNRKNFAGVSGPLVLNPHEVMPG